MLNATLFVVGPCSDMIIFNVSGEQVTDEQRRALTENCPSEELISVPSGNGLPFQLSILSGSRTTVGDTCSYIGEKTPQYQAPVFVAYNLFSLQADKVIYDQQKRTIEASGHVVATDGSGVTSRADSMAFKIENGQVALLGPLTNK
jgi:hypothetical protein